MNDEIAEARLVLRSQAGDREALEVLLRRVQQPLWRYAASLVGVQDADDVTQDTLVTVCRKIGWLEDAGRFRAWTFRIASRLAFRRLKQRKRWVELTAGEELAEGLAAVPPGDAVDPDRLAALLLADESLSPRSRAVLLLHFREGMPLATVAAVLEIPLGTVKSRLAFGLQTLRRRMAEKGHTNVR